MIQDLNPDFRINPDSGPDVCLIALKCCGFTTYLVECCENQPVTVWEVLINVIKSPILQWWAKWKSEPWSVSKTASPPKVNQFFRGPCNNNTEFQWNRLITLPPHRQNDRRTWSHKLCLGAEKNRTCGAHTANLVLCPSHTVQCLKCWLPRLSPKTTFTLFGAVIYYVTKSQKGSYLMFNNNFGKWGPIFKILLPIDS